jgi:hypothetical protein
MSFTPNLEDDAEFCRRCGITVTWTSEEWVHDYQPEDDHQPVVPEDYDDYFEE